MPAGRRPLPKLTAAVDGDLRTRLGADVTDESLLQLTRTLTRLRTAVGGRDTTEKTA